MHVNVNTTTQTLSHNFATNVARIGVEGDLSYRGLARMAGVSDNTVRRIEAARRTRVMKTKQGYVPSLGTVVKFAQAIGCSTPEILESY